MSNGMTVMSLQLDGPRPTKFGLFDPVEADLVGTVDEQRQTFERATSG
jgi:hypothetical protein